MRNLTMLACRSYILVLLGLAICLPDIVLATTTSGAQSRNLLIDGMLYAGAAPGLNGGNWETDEVFQGFQGAVNWYVSWDDDNLYLGRDGGNNAEGSILYLQADYAGAVYANAGFSYEQLEPSTVPMGGVNFAAYFKSSYDEFRTYNGAWSSASTSLSPMFGVQTTGDNMEVAIPWAAITNGNGRPGTVRFLLYQVTPAGMACPEEFVYGESPWGTGNVGDGPSVAVNDGVATSLRQPGGCNVGDSTAWRWWGCFPVVGSISANSWNFSRSVLALDTVVCANAPGLPLVATITGSGIWTQLSAPSGSAAAVVMDSTQSSTTVSNLTSAGTYIFLFTGNGTACFMSYDTVVFRVNPLPSIVTAVVDTALCPLVSFASVLSGNPDTVDWDLGSGVHLPTDTASFDYSGWGNGSYPYTLTVTNACGSDNVQGTVVIDCLVGMLEGAVGDVKVFPNPGQGQFQVKVGDDEGGILMVAVLDIWGRRVYSQAWDGASRCIVLDLPLVAPGHYLLKIETGQGTRFQTVEIMR